MDGTVPAAAPSRSTIRGGLARVLPQSLFGRLVLVLCGGLVIAQTLSALINYAERDRLLFRFSGVRIAQRIVDIVNVLETLDPVERRRVVAVLNAPPLAVSLDREPISETPVGNDDSARAAFQQVLQSALGPNRPTRVAAEGLRPPWARGGRGPREHHGGPPGGLRDMIGDPAGELRRREPRGMFFLTQVALADGTWVTFDAFVPPGMPQPGWRLATSLAILLVAVIALAWLAVRWVTRPLAVLAKAAEQLGDDLHRPPLAETGPTEVKRAAQAFNRMQGKLTGLIEERSRVMAAISHDLKTPLTRMRLRSELLDDAALRDKFTRDLDEMESMVTQSLDYMRGTSRRLTRQPIDVVALLESMQSDYTDMRQTMTLTGAASTPFVGDVQLLRRAIANVIDNAIAYGAAAEVIVEDTPQALKLRICDNGPGLPRAELERVFEPFYRLEGSRSRATGGTGLGLAIARSIIEAHGGTITLANRSTGGLEATVTLPRA